MMTDEQEKALRDFNSARQALQKVGAGKAAQGYENAYGEAYQRCVRLGLMPQIRKKYR